MSQQAEFTWRYEVQPTDREVVREMVAATGFFRDDEVGVAVELVSDRLETGDASGYHFVFIEQDGVTVGYTCYGLIACTLASYDLYWIAVHPTHQRSGFGGRLVQETERQILARQGTRVYIETSNRPQYQPTRKFYERCGYECEAVLKDFYGPDDDKVIFSKKVQRE